MTNDEILSLAIAANSLSIVILAGFVCYLLWKTLLHSDQPLPPESEYSPKLDEYILLHAIQHQTGSVRAIYTRLGMNYKQAAYILEKWASRGWYERGVCLDLGWLTAKGKEAGL